MRFLSIILADNESLFTGDDVSSLISDNFFYFVIGIIIFIVLVVVLAVIAKDQSRCSICGLPFSRLFYIWKIGGANQRLCPKCNRQMRNKVSKAAFKSKVG
jgi:hypothetical protein